MGFNDHELGNGKSKRAVAKEVRARRRASAGQVDWKEFPWQRVAVLTEELSGLGGAVRIGLTRDGGAWALGLYYDGDYAAEYIRPNEDAGTAVDEIAAVWLPAKELENYFQRVQIAPVK